MHDLNRLDKVRGGVSQVCRHTYRGVPGGSDSDGKALSWTDATRGWGDGD